MLKSYVECLALLNSLLLVSSNTYASERYMLDQDVMIRVILSKIIFPKEVKFTSLFILPMGYKSNIAIAQSSALNERTALDKSDVKN